MSNEKQQIEEMSTEIREAVNGCSSYWSGLIAKHLYEKDYRKQSENTVELPCKVGDTVYHIRRTPESKGGSYIVEAKVWSITAVIGSSGTYIKINIQYISREGVHESADSIFGKYAFLTREEAEKALAERSEK